MQGGACGAARHWAERSQAQPGHGIAHERGVVAVVGLDHGVAGVAGLAASGNEEALGSLQGVSEAYLEASKNAQATNVGYFKDLAAVKRATEAASSYADKQVDQGSAQLAALQTRRSGDLELEEEVWKATLGEEELGGADEEGKQERI